MDTNLATGRDSKPWYKQPWPWILMAIPFSSMVVGGYVIYLGFATEDGVVVGDYYKKGLAMNATLDRERKARELGLNASVQFLEENKVLLQLKTSTAAPLPEGLNLLLAHPTQQGRDINITLKRTGTDYYVGLLAQGAENPTGRWNLVLEDLSKQWRMQARAELGLTNNTAWIAPLSEM